MGLLLVAWGVLALLDGLGLVELRSVMRTFWPVALIVWGASAIAVGGDDRRWMGFIATLAGSALMGNQLAWWTVRWSMLWPVAVIAVGLRLMLHRPGWGRHARRHVLVDVQSRPLETEPAEASRAADGREGAVLREFAMFGGIERRNLSQAFRGGEVTAVLGGVQLDMRDCRMAAHEAQVEVLAVLGGVSLTIPRDWTVESRIAAILGGVDDRSAPPLDGTGKRLVLTGNAVLGGVEIKN
jgi:predicted membrane protein